MDITNQEVELIQAGIMAWETSDLRDPEIPGSEKNIVTIGRHLIVKARAGAPLDPLDVATVVEKLKMRGMLDIDKEAASREAALTLPHAGDKSLAWLDSVEAINEVGIEKLKRFTQPAAFAPLSKDASGRNLNERFSDRVTFLKKHNIRRPKTEKVENPAVEKARAELRQYIDEARQLIADLKPQDFRNVGSQGQGQITQHARGADKLNTLLSNCIRALPNWKWEQNGQERPATIREKGEYLVKLIREEIDRLTSTSVR